MADPTTLWEAWRAAMRARKSLTATVDPEGSESGLHTGRTERHVRVFPHRINDWIVVEQGTVADKVFVTEADARLIRVTVP